MESSSVSFKQVVWLDRGIIVIFSAETDKEKSITIEVSEDFIE
jgi:hypothetical protein